MITIQKPFKKYQHRWAALPDLVAENVIVQVEEELETNDTKFSTPSFWSMTKPSQMSIFIVGELYELADFQHSYRHAHCHTALAVPNGMLHKR